MAFDAFFKLDTITGESTDSKFPGAMEIFNFSLGASNPVTIGSAAGGGGGGKASFQSFSFSKKTDSASPTLFQACVTGAHMATGTVSLRKAGGTALVYLTYGIQSRLRRIHLMERQHGRRRFADGARVRGFRNVDGRLSASGQHRRAQRAARSTAVGTCRRTSRHSSFFAKAASRRPARCGFSFLWGSQSWLQPLSGGFSGRAKISTAVRKSWPKAGCSQGWLRYI